MHLPAIDPNVVLWCNVVADGFTVAASGTAAFVAIRHYALTLRESVAKAAERVQERL